MVQGDNNLIPRERSGVGDKQNRESRAWKVSPRQWGCPLVGCFLCALDEWAKVERPGGPAETQVNAKLVLGARRIQSKQRPMAWPTWDKALQPEPPVRATG